MKSKNFWKIFAVAVVVLFAIGFFYIYEGSKNTNNLRSINVQGVEEQEFKADKAILSVGVEEKTNDIEAGNEKVKTTLNNLKTALSSLNVEMETSSYNVRENREWNEETRKYKDDGYVVSSSLIITINNVDQVTYVLSEVIKSGSNRVNYLNYELDEDHLEEIKLDLYAKAAGKAKQKAEAIAEGSDEEIYKLQSISENSGYYPIYRESLATKDVAMAVSGEAGSSGDYIFENKIPVRVTVSASYLLK